nr:RsmB/NOP family class I SAM-dependent RNA methyltransferase [Halorhodospira halophila]
MDRRGRGDRVGTIPAGLNCGVFPGGIVARRERYQPPEDLARGESAYTRYRAVIDDWQAFCDALQRPLSPCLRANTTRLTRDELDKLLRDEGWDPRPLGWQGDALLVDGGFRPGHHWGAIAGLYQIQEAASLLPVQLLDPRPGERVLDLCAAPGNKTVQVADALGNRGTVVANDASAGRLGALGQAVKRHGVVNVSQTVRDGQGMPWAAGRFDKVVVDAPCSCEGTFRKTATAAEPTSPAFRQRLVQRQQRLLLRGMALTRPGGTVVYSTCTFAPEENEAVVAAALARCSGAFELIPARVAGLQLSPGLEAWDGVDFGADMAACGRLWPHHNDTGGFFVALLRRVDDGSSQSEDPLPLPEEPRARTLLQTFEDELGVSAEVLDGLTAFFEGSKYAKVVAADHTAAGGIPVVRSGIPAVRAQTRPPKPSTAGVMALGHHARGAVLELERAEVYAFFRREPLLLGPERGSGLREGGHVVLRHRGHTIGIGMYRNGAMVSLFPKAWSRAAGGTVG